jgi:hypothetical protein
MVDRSELIRQADALKKQAEREPDSGIRQRLIEMAETYVHLAETESWSEGHPTSIASVSKVFIKED